MSTKRWIVSMLAAALCIGTALCQESKPTGVLVRIGNFMPSSLQARNAGKGWYLFGAQVDIRSRDLKSSNSKSTIAVSIDAMTKGSLSAVPILLNFVTQTDKTLFSFGVGGAFDREVRFTQAGEEKKSRMEFAYQLSVGYDISKYGIPGIIEGKYFGNGYDTLSGFALCLGFRF